MDMVVKGRNQSRIAPNQIKLEETVDRISALQDCLLLEILNRLPSTKDAIRTGILSKQWEHLWTSVHTLIFRYTASFDSLNPSGTNPNSMSDFVSFVDKTLTQCRGLKLKKFVVYTKYDILFESQINNWIHYAVGCDVEELDLTFPRMGLGVRFMLDKKFFTSSCFTHLKLSGCIYNPTGAISWKNLKRLCISCDIIDEDLIENMLSGSPQLEMLGLIYCYGYKRLNITSKSVKCLVFNSYMVPSDQFNTGIIEINAPNILSLSIQGSLVLWKLLLLNVSSLVEAELDYRKFGPYETTHEEAEEEMLKGFILNLDHVQELNIGQSCYEVMYRLLSKGFHCTSNMKFPGISYDSSDSDSIESGDFD